MAIFPVTYDRAGPSLAATGSPLSRRGQSALLEIEDAVKTERSFELHEVVARILERRATDPGLLGSVHSTGSRDRYTRHLVYAGPGFSILALVWLPGQMSPIHGHQSWCALGVRQGMLVETCFTRVEADVEIDADTDIEMGVEMGPVLSHHLTLDSCRQLLPGMVSHSDGAEEHYHRVANLGVETAISIHVYGVPFDRLGHGLNRIWEDEA